MLDLWIVRINILFKKLGLLVNQVVCQVDEHVVDVFQRRGEWFCRKPAGEQIEFCSSKADPLLLAGNDTSSQADP